MMFKVLQKYYKEGDSQIEKIEQPDSFYKERNSGKPFNYDGKIQLQLENNKGRMTDFLIGATQLLVISDKVKNIILSIESPSNLEFIPIDVVNMIGSPKEYWILNILNNLKGMDRDRSEFEELPSFLTEDSPELAEMPKTISKLVLKSDLKGRHIFRIVEQPVAVFCSQELVQAMKENNCTGVEFVTLENFPTMFYAT